MKKLIAGNWKMNGALGSSSALLEEICRRLAAGGELYKKCDLAIFPPYPYLAEMRDILFERDEDRLISLGAQDCAATTDGAYTGDISAAMLKDCGCSHVILGHSERRQHHAEPDGIIAKKAALAHEQGLITIICVGETDAQRSAGQELDVVRAQLDASLPASATAANTVIAYEPVWAIGTGKTATVGNVRDMHVFIRSHLQEKLADFARMRILYGGSVKPDNAAALLAVENVDGALVGGASLKADQFLAIAAAA